MGAIYFCIGLVLGGVLMNLAVEEERNKNQKLQKKLGKLRHELDQEILKVGQRDLLIKGFQDEHEILLMNAKELRDKIQELENKKELVADYQSQN